MKIGRHNKILLFELELVTFLFIIFLGYVFYLYQYNPLFYLTSLLIGFVLYFWMLVEESIHKTGKKHDYFEHTSSYLMLGQTFLVLGLLFLHLKTQFLIFIFLVLSVIMYSVSLSRIILYKLVFPK